ncbi:MAG: hypothetical protein ACFFC7_14640 [Candidatus Hermodarchaeota archaeon]
MFEILLALSKMAHGKGDGLKNAWKVLDSKQDSKGRYLLDWTPSQSPWKVGRKN